jgi:preprotein translocase subunit SecY
MSYRAVSNALRRLPAVWRRIALATGGLLLCEIGARIVAPSINGRVLADYLRQVGASPLLKLYDWFVGGALSRGAILALGIMPYLSARLIMRLARESFPGIAEMSKSETERPRLERWTRRLTFGLAAVQSFGFARFVQSIPGAVTDPGVGFIAQTMIVLTTGAMGVAWFSERIARQRDVDGPASEAEPELSPGSRELSADKTRPALPPADILDRVPTKTPEPDRVRLGL